MTKAEYPLLFAIFLDMMGFGMVLPDVQLRLEAFRAPGWLIGAVLAAYFLTQLLVSPLWGRASDRIGRKPVLLLCGGLSAGSMLLYGFAHGVAGILSSRVLAGVAAANVVVAQAYLADTTDEATRTAAMGRVGVATTAGLILGPVLGGWLASAGGNLLLGSVAAGASLLGVIWIGFAVPGCKPAPAPGKPRHVYLIDISLLQGDPALRRLFGLAAAAFFALACLEGTFGRLIRYRFGYGVFEFGLIFSYEALLGVWVQAVLLKRIPDRWAGYPLLRAGYVMQGVGLALTPFAPNLAGLFVTSALYAVGMGLATPTLNGLCSAATPQERQGEMFGLLQAARSAGFLLGPIAGGALFDWKPASPYLLAGAVAIAVGLLATLRGARRPVSSPPDA